QRMKDIGIRMAIGAAPANIGRRFIAMGLQVGVAGGFHGLGLVLITARVIQSLLYGVSSTDATSLLVASAMVLAVVTTAAAIPAWRASRMDPIAVLRHSCPRHGGRGENGRRQRSKRLLQTAERGNGDERGEEANGNEA